MSAAEITGAICGGSPYVWKTEPEPPRWCFAERKRLPGVWELCGAFPDPKVHGLPMLDDGTPDPILMWEPVWSYRCLGCGRDASHFGDGAW